MAKRLTTLLCLAAMALAGAALMTGGSRSAVDWRPVRAVVLESDDWGLAGFVPDGEAWQDVDREALRPGRFPEVYWRSTLEDSAMVAQLNAILGARPGRDGRPAVFQPNYVMSSLSPEGADGEWHRYDLPQAPPAYARPGLWTAVFAGIGAGTWYPEFHATWHYDPALRRRNTAGDATARAAAARGIMLFPDGELARELGPWRSLAELADELDGSLARFEHLFGRRPGSVIAPDYTWNGRIEDLWQSRGLRVIQGKREQRNPDFGGRRWGRLRKYADRQWSRVARPGRVYLERNCRLEPVQSADPAAVVRDCLNAVGTAWRRGQPAIIETHRINFAHVDSDVVSRGQRGLASVLDALTSDPLQAPVFLTDTEVAQLRRRGTSWCARGGVVVVRNAGRSRRVVAIPPEAFAGAARQRGLTPGAVAAVLVALEPQTTVELAPQQRLGASSSHR